MALRLTFALLGAFRSTDYFMLPPRSFNLGAVPDALALAQQHNPPASADLRLQRIYLIGFLQFIAADFVKPVAEAFPPLVGKTGGLGESGDAPSVPRDRVVRVESDIDNQLGA